jgi:hypothetical protein
MAKKQRQSILNNIEQTVGYLYLSGVWHSLIVHTIIFLIMAMLFPVVVDKQRIVIELNFASVEENVEPLTEPLEEPPIKIVSLEESKDTLEAASIDAGISAVSLMEDTLKIENIPVPDTGFDKPSDFIDNIAADVLTEEIKTASPMPDPKVVYTGRTNTQVLLSRRGELDQQSVSNIAEQMKVGEIQKRLKEYGAKTGDVQISLSWDTIDDLDLHVLVKPIGSNINWTNRVGFCGGALDIDMNAHPRLLSPRPIENIFWAPGNAPFAEYVVGVHFFMNWSRAQQVKGTLIIRVDGKTETLPLLVHYGDPVRPITSFVRQR